jgi:hypothetical protein
MAGAVALVGPEIRRRSQRYMIDSSLFRLRAWADIVRTRPAKASLHLLLGKIDDTQLFPEVSVLA